jgi:hypothetical protein
MALPQTTNDAKEEKKGLQTRHVILILGTVLIVSATVVVTILLLREDTQPVSTIPQMQTSYIIDENNVAGIMDDIRQKVEKGMFMTHMNNIWTFPDGESASSDAVMGNSESNNYPFWFDVSVEGEQVFKSSLLPLGSQIKEIVLTKDLDAGTYPAVVNIHMIDENDQEVESNMGFDVTLVIQA